MTRSAVRDFYFTLDRRERIRAGLLIVLAGIAAVAEAVGIGAILPVMKLVNDPAGMLAMPSVQGLYRLSGADDIREFTLWALLAVVAVFMLKNAYLALVYMWQARFVGTVESRLATRLVRSYLNADFASRLSQHSADRIRIVTTEVPRVTAGYLLPLLGLITELFVVGGVLAILLWLQPLAALVSLSVIGTALILLQRAIGRRLATLREERAQANSGMYKWATESLAALKETQALGRSHFFVDRFAGAAHRHATATAAFTVIGLLPRLVVETIIVAALMCGLAVGVALGNSIGEVLPVLTVFGVAAVRLMPSSTRIISSFASLRFFAPAVHAVVDGIREAKEVGSPAPEEMVRRSGHVATLAFDAVTYRYPGAVADSLREISVTIRRGEFVAVVGSSGSGKSTLGDMLLGLLVPNSGRILVNDRAVTSLMAEIRGAASLVPQHFHLMDDTVRRNVAFGIPDNAINDSQVWAALELAQVDVRVRTLREGLDTVVGENAGFLSGGERQRLALARALYDNPDLLVLDEATSALDNETEQGIMDTLRDVATHRSVAVVLITHRLGSLSLCDRIIVMHQGAIAADGTPGGASGEEVIAAADRVLSPQGRNH